MPIPLAAHGLFEGIDAIPYVWTAAKALPLLAILWIAKTYFGGARNTSERNMHSKVVMITGGTSGIGAAVASSLALRGAQLVLLTQHSLDDPFLQDYILDLRSSTNNELITAVECDLSSLHSIRQFATKWIDNAPPRRLDMIVLCASTMTPKGSPLKASHDGVESNYAINYLANFHLLSILSPAIRAQPPDRDLRILFATCSSYMGGRMLEEIPRSLKVSKKKQARTEDTADTSITYASSKLALMTFADAFQKHLSNYVRPDKQPNNARVFLIDPGWCRTPGMRRYLSRGSLLGLAIYLIMWPLWWLLLKSAEQGAQTFLWAAMDAEFENADGGKFLKEVIEAKLYRNEVRDESIQKNLWEISEKGVEALEKEGAAKRASEKKEAEDLAKPEEEAKKTEAKQAATTTEKQAGSRRSKRAGKL